MTTNSNVRPNEQVDAVATTDAEMLDKVYTRLVRIHGSMAEATNDDSEILPWSLAQLMAVIRDMGVHRKERRAPRR
jgi:hypothetical protein